MPLDIGIGILLALFTHSIFVVPLTAGLVLVGIIATLLPDIDIVTVFFGRWRHREITHYPLLYAIPCALLFLIIPAQYAFLITTGILAHFFHDTVGTGWGISWLWPFTPRRFLILPDGERRREMGMLATWLPSEKPAWAHHGPHTWIRDTYFRPSMTAIVEYSVFAIVLLTLFLYIW